MPSKPRVAMLQLFHEANAFAPLPIRLQDFTARHYLAGEAMRSRFRNTGTWQGGVLEQLEQHGAITEIGLCTASLPGGPVDKASYEALCQALLDSLRAILARGRVDAVMLLLHGALVVDGVPHPEGDLAEAVRTLVGPDTPIGCTLDFHANVNPNLPPAVDILIGGKLYPHTDVAERGRRAVDLTLDCLRQRRRTWHFRLPIMIPMARQASMDGPFAVLVAESEAIAARHGVDDVSLLGGFPYADSDFTCSSVLVVGQDEVVARQAFTEMAAAVWRDRAALLEPVEALPNVMRTVKAAAQSGRVVLADVGDNPGGGALGNDTSLLGALIETGLPFAAGAIVDPEVAAQAAAAGVGTPISVQLGLREDGTPLPLDVVVERAGDISYRNIGTMMHGDLLEGGLGAVLRVGQHGHVLVTTRRIQAYDINAFLSQGIDLDTKSVILVKSIGHFRASYTALATGGVIVADSRAWSSSDATRFVFHKLPSRIMPLTMLDKRAWDSFIAQEVAQAR